MSRCTEPLLWFCSSCSHPFEIGEWEGHGRSCPVCHSNCGVWRCGKCSGEFGQPSLGSEHPCLAITSLLDGAQLLTHNQKKSRFSSHSDSSLPQNEMINYIEREREKATRDEWDKIWKEYIEAKKRKKKL
jgi:hypothetical protein